MHKVLTLQEKLEWTRLLKRLPEIQQDIHYTPEYYQLYENYGNGRAHCFVFEKDGNIALYPFLLNNINDLGYNLDKQYFDIQGAYGYNGIVSNCDDDSFCKEFFRELSNYCISKKIVAEFTRFNPILQNHLFGKNHYEIRSPMGNVIVNLNENDFLYSSYEHSTRKNIKKAKKNGLKVNVFQGNSVGHDLIEKFLVIYQKTMERNNVNKEARYDFSFFESLFRLTKSNVLLSFTQFKDQDISAEVVTFGSKIAYSFLGGTDEKFFYLRPNDILKHQLIHFLKESGLEYYCLGGGQNGVLKYKKTFSKNGLVDFFIGKKIYFREIYKNLIHQWEAKKIKSFDNEILLRYRSF